MNLLIFVSPYPLKVSISSFLKSVSCHAKMPSTVLGGFLSKPYRQRTSYFRRKWLGAVHVIIAPSKTNNKMKVMSAIELMPGISGFQLSTVRLLPAQIQYQNSYMPQINHIQKKG
jgi:hypothetical protein